MNNEFMKILSIWTIVNRIIQDIVASGSIPNAPLVARQATTALQGKVGSGMLPAEVLQDHEKLIPQMIAMHPDVENMPGTSAV